MSKKIFQTIILLALLFASLAGPGKVEAWVGCGSTYTVQWGNTLSGIAASCGTTMDAIRLANPGLGSWVYAGQVLMLPGASWDAGGGYSVYIVNHGDTLKNIAIRFGTTMDVLASLNGIYNYNLIYAGQRLTIPSAGYIPPVPPPPPSSGSTYIIQPGETLRILAYRWGVSTYDILAVNPQITNANVIYVGQVINIPGVSIAPNPSYYTVKAGDTLRIIANIYGTTVYNLQVLNPQIWNPNWIYVGMVLRVQ